MATEKKTLKTVQIKTDEKDPIGLELVAEGIIEISKSFKAIQNSRLKQRAIVLLIHDSIPASKRVGIREIETILEYAPLIATFFIKKI